MMGRWKRKKGEKRTWEGGGSDERYASVGGLREGEREGRKRGPA